MAARKAHIRRANGSPVRMLAIATLLLGAAAVPAGAHMWYPISCCHGEDCMKVDRIEYLDDGSMVMYARNLSVTVPRGFSQRPSQDTDGAHVCVYLRGKGVWLPRCVFLPAGA